MIKGVYGFYQLARWEGAEIFNAGVSPDARNYDPTDQEIAAALQDFFGVEPEDVEPAEVDEETGRAIHWHVSFVRETVTSFPVYKLIEEGGRPK